MRQRLAMQRHEMQMIPAGIYRRHWSMLPKIWTLANDGGIGDSRHLASSQCHARIWAWRSLANPRRHHRQ
jgi:hypothetical protein